MQQQLDQALNGQLYGRQWRVLIQDKENTALDVSDLRVTFNINKQATGQPATCHAMIYNLAPQTEARIIKEGFYITIEAGYEGQYGVVFAGDIIQVFRNREEGINYKLEIVAVDGSTFLDLNFIKTTAAAGSTPRDVVQDVSRLAGTAIEIEELSFNLGEQKLPRPKVYFGLAKDYLDDTCKGSSSFYWVNNGKLFVRRYTDPVPINQCLDLNVESGLVGTPEYTDDGIRIVSLLNPRMTVRGMIKIDNSIINRQAIGLPVNNINQTTIFDQDGEYEIYSLTHSGDTHGENWITEAICIGRNGRAALPVLVDNADQDIRG